ncbi:hypothetical protein APT63_14985 [Pseudomonas sp. 22-AL-CL-001]|nr:hypothetical protein APT63_14985 [Pseudomonas monteilii]
MSFSYFFRGHFAHLVTKLIIAVNINHGRCHSSSVQVGHDYSSIRFHKRMHTPCSSIKANDGHAAFSCFHTDQWIRIFTGGQQEDVTVYEMVTYVFLRSQPLNIAANVVLMNFSCGNKIFIFC